MEIHNEAQDRGSDICVKHSGINPDSILFTQINR